MKTRASAFLSGCLTALLVLALIFATWRAWRQKKRGLQPDAGDWTEQDAAGGPSPL